jgi:membrane protein YdbS with pleckstrin-like domain
MRACAPLLKCAIKPSRGWGQAFSLRPPFRGQFGTTREPRTSQTVTPCYDARVQLRPSIKLIQLAYIVSLVAAVTIAIYLLSIHDRDDRLWALLLLPAIAVVFAGIRHLRRRLTKLTVLDDRLRFESGLFSKTTRTIELAKVQDVRVDQTLGQRILKIGDLSLESAGGTSRIVMQSIDRPQEAADYILERSRASHPGV